MESANDFALIPLSYTLTRENLRPIYDMASARGGGGHGHTGTGENRKERSFGTVH